MYLRSFFVALACLVTLPLAHAAIGEPPEMLLAAVAEYGPAEFEEGNYRAADSFEFELELRGGRVFELSGEGVLNERNVEFMADLIAAGTDYGESISAPVAEFLATRAADLAGRGETAIGVEQYRLALDVTGNARPYEVRFTLGLQEVPAEAFPPGRHELGAADARYVIREFSDFQCPYCASYASQVLPLIKERLLARGDVRFEYHHFPLRSIHANAAPAAEAAECVSAVNTAMDFWEYHDALFERQRAWQGLGDPAPYFVRLADELGLDPAGVAECLEEDRFQTVVSDSYRLAAAELGLTGTPSLFVNGYKVENYLDLQAYLDLIELVDSFSDE
ncbi:MAG: DsbA family protein [Trueperaceae bacterium]